MKTKEEIEQLTDFKYQHFTNGATQNHFKLGFIEGYTQCQEDMDKKYTESQLRDAMEEAMCYSKLRQITEYINSLNKQD